MEIRPAEPGELAAAAALLDAHGLAPGRERLAARLRHPRHRPEGLLLALDSGRPSGALLASHVRLRLGAASVECGALELAAPPDLAADLIGAALPALHDSGASALLCRAPARDLAPLGMAPVATACSARLPALAGGGALRPAAEGDLDDLAALYDAAHRPIPLSEERTPADWRALLAWADLRLLEDQRGRAAAYARLAGGAVTEGAAADAGAALAMLRALPAGATLEGLPPAHPLARACLQAGGELRLREPGPAEPQLLAGVLDLRAAAEQLAPELLRRLAASRYAGWEGAVAVELPGERLVLRVARGAVAALSLGDADVRLRRASLGGLAQLLLGRRAADELRAAGELDCDDTALGLLGALFPPVG